jgi:glucosamine-6-phosphate deaminase
VTEPDKPERKKGNHVSSTIDTKQLYEWCSIPPDALPDHPESKVCLEVFEQKEAVFRHTADLMADEVIANNAAGKATRWILAAGPMEQYAHFSERVNTEGISLRDVHVFHMDDFLDWQGRPFPVQNDYYSLEGNMLADFYGKIDENLNVPEAQRHFPRIGNLDQIDEAVEGLGGIDTLIGGLGYKGLVAFCEAPRSPFFTVTEQEYAASKSRIVTLHPETIISLSERDMGGLTHNIPPMAVTLGFKSMLSAKRAIFLVTTGSWKRTALRVLMFSEPTVEYPATLFPKYVSEVTVLADPDTVRMPLENERP